MGTDINSSIIITSAVTLKQKKSFFFLLQSDLGDVYDRPFCSLPHPPLLTPISDTAFSSITTATLLQL